MHKETKRVLKAYLRAGWVEVNAKSGGHVKLVPPTGTVPPSGQYPFVILSCSPKNATGAVRAQVAEARRWGVEL
jgi:hypothetical protein